MLRRNSLVIIPAIISILIAGIFTTLHINIFYVDLFLWLFLFVWIILVRKLKRNSDFSFSFAVVLFVFSAIVNTIGLVYFSELVMRIAFISWIIAIIQAFFEYKTHYRTRD